MTTFHGVTQKSIWKSSVNLIYDKVLPVVHDGQFEIWQFTTVGIQLSIWYMTKYHQWYTKVNLKNDEVLPAVSYVSM